MEFIGFRPVSLSWETRLGFLPYRQGLDDDFIFNFQTNFSWLNICFFLASSLVNRSDIWKKEYYLKILHSSKEFVQSLNLRQLKDTLYPSKVHVKSYCVFNKAIRLYIFNLDFIVIDSERLIFVSNSRLLSFTFWTIFWAMVWPWSLWAVSRTV